MEDSFCQALIQSCDPDDDSYVHEDAMDEPHCINLMNTILSGTAPLNVLLPSATILAFTIFTPLLTNDGKCTTLNLWFMAFFLLISASSCIFFSVTDSFRTQTERLYYDVVTCKGTWTFNGGRKKPLVSSDYKLRWSDLFHGSLSLTAFLTFAASYNDVYECYYPTMSKKVTNSVPLVVGFLLSVLFVAFPTRRKGIVLKQGDPLSPALFVIAAEMFSRGLKRLMENDTVQNFSQPTGTQKISHLGFADDILIFCNAGRG